MKRVALVDVKNEKENELVVIRGFLAKDQKGLIYLTSEPNVPTCCAGKNVKSEILVEGLPLAALPQNAVSVMGELRREGAKFYLGNAAWESESSTFSYPEISLLVVPFILLWGWRKFVASSR